MLNNPNTALRVSNSEIANATESHFLELVLNLLMLPPKFGLERRYTDYIELLNSIAELVEKRLKLIDQREIDKLRLAFGYSSTSTENDI
jgi:hypothetical protein